MLGKSKIDIYTKYVKDFGFEDVNSFLTAGKSTQGLLVCEKSKALLYRIYPALKNFPKAEKHALCAEIKNGFYALISNINSASSVPSLRKKYANSRNFIKSIIDRRPYIKLENNTLKINEEELYCYIETMEKTNGN